jgi:hypothetical protein
MTLVQCHYAKTLLSFEDLMFSIFLQIVDFYAVKSKNIQLLNFSLRDLFLEIK